MKSKFMTLTALAIGATGAPLFAADTPQQQYDTSMTCAAVIGAAIAQDALPAGISAERAMPLQTAYMRQATAAGHASGRTDETVARDVDRLQGTISARMTGSDPVKANRERTETAAMTGIAPPCSGFSPNSKPLGTTRYNLPGIEVGSYSCNIQPVV